MRTFWCSHSLSSPDRLFRGRLAGQRELLCLLVALAAPWSAIAHSDHDHGTGTEPAAAVVGSPASGSSSEEAALRKDSPTNSIERAIARWTAQTAAQPGDVAAWLSLGDALMQRSRDRSIPGLLDRAEAAYHRAAEIEPQNPAAWVGLGWVANTRHDFSAGRRWLKRALESDPQLPEAHALLGDAAVEAGDYDVAMDHYQVALDRRPDLASYARAAHLLWLTGQPSRARMLMGKAIAAGGPHAENVAWCRAELALMLFQEGALLPAENLLKQTLAEAPDNPHALAAMGRVQMARKQYTAAIDSYQRAASLLPQHASLAALVDLHTWNGQPDEARRAMQRLLEYHETHEHAEDHNGPGVVAENPAENPKAEADSKGDGRKHSHVHGNAELARFMADHELDLDHALAEAEEAYQSYKSVGVTDTLAWCGYRKGNLVEARRLILRAMKWGTPDAQLLYHAGMIHARLGETSKAKKFLYQALSLNPRFHPVEAETAARTLRELSAGKFTDRAEHAAAKAPAGAIH
jgi:tetratricopeptide (TPR) repeat protein